MELLTNIGSEVWWWLGAIFFVIGVVGAVQAIMETRTSQGAIAWVAALLALPLLAVPLYWVFGYKRFKGYKRGSDIFSARSVTKQHEKILDEFARHEITLKPLFKHKNAWQQGAFSYFSEGNTVNLLIDGEAAYECIFNRLKAAKKYILIEYYIIQADETGARLAAILKQKAKEGVSCYVIFDSLGAKKYKKYADELRKAGVHIYPFDTTRGALNKLRFNFRNHRKIVVVDGEHAITGGINIGDEYIGKHKTLTPWRDTNVEVSGPAVLLLQYTFQRDWEYASGKQLKDIEWEIGSKKGEADVMVVPTSPASVYDYGSIFFLHLINTAQKRIWIFNPYFVPDEQFVSALQLASLRGVEVKIVTPAVSDSDFIHKIGVGVMYNFTTFENIEWRQYTKGFMHQKVFLIDDDITLVGTHNFDNRSFRLNFEVSVLIKDRDFYNKVKTMMMLDLQSTRLADKGLYSKLLFHKRFIIRLYSLLSPIS